LAIGAPAGWDIGRVCVGWGAASARPGLLARHHNAPLKHHAPQLPHSQQACHTHDERALRRYMMSAAPVDFTSSNCRHRTHTRHHHTREFNSPTPPDHVPSLRRNTRPPGGEPSHATQRCSHSKVSWCVPGCGRGSGVAATPAQ
jgi:hypothetical protein